MVYYSYTGTPTIGTSGNYTVLTFNSNGSFTSNSDLNINYIIVGGGGSGNGYASGGGPGGGGGEVLTGNFLSDKGYFYSINVGLGGSVGNNGNNGEPSIFNGTTNETYLYISANGGYKGDSLLINGGNSGNGGGGGIFNGANATNGGGAAGTSNRGNGRNGASVSIIDYTGNVTTKYGGGGGGGGYYGNGGNGGSGNSSSSDSGANGGDGDGYGGGGGGGGYLSAILTAGSSGTVILYFVDSPPSACFNHDTKILCFDEELNQEVYVPIQDMKVGTIVKSYKHGYKKIEFIGKGKNINNPDDKYRSMYKMKKQGEMLDDLILTGNHSILVDRFKNIEADRQKTEFENNGFYMIDDKYILFVKNSLLFEQIMDNELYTYYHFVLENDEENKDDDCVRYGIWANGVLAESSDKKHFIKHGYESL